MALFGIYKKDSWVSWFFIDILYSRECLFRITTMQNLETILSTNDFVTKNILTTLIEANKALAELKGISHILPNTAILMNTLSLQEAKSSSEVENIITTQDDLYQSNYLQKQFSTIAAKEVYSYAEALYTGWENVKKNKIITINDIITLQSLIEKNDAGIRKIDGVRIGNEKTGEIVYIPPQWIENIMSHLKDLEYFINTDDDWLDPLIKVAIIHHHFESIHPFYDGNWRTGRILNVLYLVLTNCIDLPILYLSRYINTHKSEYYRLIQDVRDNNNWEAWILYILTAIKETSHSTTKIINDITQLMKAQKHLIRDQLPKLYSQDLINNIFKHPYTKIEFVMTDLKCERRAATKRLESLVELGILYKVKKGKENYYINKTLFSLLENVNA